MTTKSIYISGPEDKEVYIEHLQEEGKADDMQPTIGCRAQKQVDEDDRTLHPRMPKFSRTKWPVLKFCYFT